MENKKLYLDIMIDITDRILRKGINVENTAQLDAMMTAEASFMDERSFGVEGRKKTVRNHVKAIQVTARYLKENRITVDDLRKHYPAEWWTQIPPFDKTS